MGAPGETNDDESTSDQSQLREILGGGRAPRTPASARNKARADRAQQTPARSRGKEIFLIAHTVRCT